MAEVEKDTVEFTTSEELVSKFFAPEPEPVRAEFGSLSHPGKVRERNEDHFAIVQRHRTRRVLMTNLPEGLLLPSEQNAYAMIVADRMGGEVLGHFASMMALRAGWELAGTEIKWPLHINEDEVAELMQKLELYPLLMQRALTEKAEQNSELEGMGTTLTCAYTVGPDAFLLHVGDSRAYLHRDGHFRQLTTDHTLAQEMVDSGVLSPEAEELVRMRHVLNNCLRAGDSEARVETHNLKLFDGDRLLLCTDGLTDLVEDSEIAGVLNREEGPQAACDSLVQLALDRGGKDNVTVVLARYSVPARRRP